MLGELWVLFLACNLAVYATGEDCVSRQEFDKLQGDLHYWQNTTLSVIKDFAYMKQGENECNNQQEIQDLQMQQNNLTKIMEDFISRLENHSQIQCTQSTMLTSLPLGSFLNPAASCENITTSSPSGNYWIQSTSTGYAAIQYCQKSPPCSCSNTSHWMRVAQLNMSNSQDLCPPGFKTTTSPKSVCEKIRGPGCASTTFPVNGVKYKRVCGKIIGYQHSTPDAFGPYYYGRGRTIDDGYVDGVSLTHGQFPRQHIWTFANAVDEIRSQHWVCPCTKTDSTYTGIVPPFIGNDYFCDTGSRYHYAFHWYTADPVWDGKGCGGSSTCCEFNNPPWFCKDLPRSTTDDIELRLCADESLNNEDVGLELVEIYVQ